MAGNSAGAIRVRDKNLARDPDFYKKIGSRGGKAAGEDYQKGGIKAAGFAANPDLARIYGAKGGRISRRKKADVQAN